MYNRISIIPRLLNYKLKTKLCFLLGTSGVCYESADCKYGYNCNHPICDTAHHQCLCGRKIYFLIYCFSSFHPKARKHTQRIDWLMLYIPIKLYTYLYTIYYIYLTLPLRLKGCNIWLTLGTYCLWVVP